MAAMAPALTDAPAEAHHIRFKLAPPSSTLSPGSVENNSNASNILISGNVKRKAAAPPSEECSLDFRGSSNNKKEEQQPVEGPPTPLAKLQPLVASYLCSDVTSVPSTKESLKLQGVLIKQSVLKTQGILPGSYFSGDFLPRKHQTLELCGEQLKSLMSSSGQPTAPPPSQTPVNGLARKQARTSIDRESAPSLNGGQPEAGRDSPPREAEPLSAQEDLASRTLHKGGTEQRPQPAGLSCNVASSSEQPAGPAASAVVSAVHECLDVKPEVVGSPLAAPVREGEGAACSSPAEPQAQLDIRERTLQSQSRQGEIEGRLRRLRKRLQVVQAKQVERHIQQQLSGLLHTALGKMPSLDALRRRSPAILTRKTEAALWRAAAEAGTGDGLGRFLREGTVPLELDRLSLSGVANLRSAESAFDSDVTESSSGGETDVEEDELTKADINQCHISIWRRAEGRYATERASIISHWNWLQAQISDLEYRIRQQTDIYRHIRTNKGLVELGDLAPCDTSLEDGAELKGQFERVETVDCQVILDRRSEGSEGMAPAQSPSAESGLWKGYDSGRQVNGVINSTCVAARTRPLLSWKKRRLVRPSTVTNLHRKVQRGPTSRSPCDVNSTCVMCGGRLTPSAEFQFDRPLLERLSQFDPCIHPILSFNDDVCMNLHLQRVLKTHWQNKPLERSKPLKKLSLKHKVPLGSRLLDPPSKDKHKLANSLLAAVRFHKLRPEKLHRQQLDSLLSESRLEGRALCKAERTQGPSLGAFDRGHSRKRPRDHSMERPDVTSKLFMDTGSPCSSLTSLHTPTHSPLMRQLSASSESSTHLGPGSQSATATPQPIRRRRGESSFDINNIVIPMSVAATTRVEKLQYKEILTPSWRKVNIFAQPIAEEDESVEIEDLSDSAFAQLHQPCEDQERSRWTWVASAPAKRRGSRSYKSLDGRTTPLLGGTNPSTPQPASPDLPHFHVLQDYGPVPSPHSPASPDLLSNPHTPCSRDSQRLQSSEDTSCSTPDFTFEEQTVQPFERRNFPLVEDPGEEQEDPGSLESERQSRGIRRISGSRLSLSRSESENGPSSPFLEESCKQKPAPTQR
ncbi:KAT8 regulatory NSL complex subunit 1 [Paramormyrops kingsleyae]|uniref:KAT8 regulatory NSL complex subunit 1 n=1 Tax=Paramormyrops kingsleyae TaxID=1676925 RepID=UPI003B97A201